MSKGQVTWFMLFGFLALCVVLAFIFWPREGGAIKDPMEDVGKLLSDCFQGKAEDAIREVSLHGGLADGLAIFGDGGVPVPSSQDIESRISKTLDQFAVTCDPALPAGLRIVSRGEPDAKVMLENESVKISLDYPITVSSESQQRSYSAFPIELPSRIDEMRVAEGYLTSAFKASGKLDMTDLIARNITSDIRPHDGGYHITFLDYHMTREEPTRFIFSLR